MDQHNGPESFDQHLQRLAQADGLPFSDLLTPERVARVTVDLDPKRRRRLFTPVTVLWTFLSQVLSADHSCLDAVARLLAWRVSRGLSACSTNTASYCVARQELPCEIIQQLVRQGAADHERQADPAWLWHGMHVKIVDGSAATMADTTENQAKYPQSSNQPAGVGFPIVRVLVILSLATAMLQDLALAAMRGKKTGETTLFRLLKHNLQPNDLALLDRLFCSYRDIADCCARGVHVVARKHQSRKNESDSATWTATDDRIVEWSRPKFNSDRFEMSEWEALPLTMRVRQITYRIRQKGFRDDQVSVITTLLDPIEFPAGEIAALYRQRWNCELDLRSIKTSLQMEHLRCKSPEMVEKEIWMHMLAYNLIRETMAESARKHTQLPRHLSFMAAVQLVNAFVPYLPQLRGDSQAAWEALLDAIAEHQVGQRPDRIEPRIKKRRPKNYPLMTRPRNEERRRLCA